jgi:prepilin-type N-terminal cleavage/methylation domain-containing protein
MKISVNKRIKSAGFTLIEMIGVLAVIAILASLLIPKIFNAINDAKINNAVLSYNTVKTAVMEHYAKYNSFTGSTNGAPIGAYTNDFASQLLIEGLIDKPFTTRVGTTNLVKVVGGSSTIGTAGAYDLDGDGSASETPTGVSVVEVQLVGVAYADAKDINDRLDGSAAPFTFPAAPSTPDNIGRVKYDGSSLISIYIGHR